MADTFEYKLKDYENKKITNSITIEKVNELKADFLLFVWSETGGVYFNAIELLDFLEQMAGFVSKQVVSMNNIKSNPDLREKFKKELEANSVLQEAFFDLQEITEQNKLIEKLSKNSDSIRKKIKKLILLLEKNFLGAIKSCQKK